MFVKWITKDGVDFLYECNSVVTEPLRDHKTGEATEFLLTLKNEHGMDIATLDIKKDGDQIYIMNNDGKTIDSHHWRLADDKNSVSVSA